MSSFPSLVLVGASGSGKSEVAEALGLQLGLPVVESEENASLILGSPVGVAMTDDPESALEALAVAACEVLTPNGPGAGSIVVLSASSILNPEVFEGVVEAKAGGARVVGLRASLSTLVRRNGLDAPRPAALGTPRAWFRAQLTVLEEAYSKVVDLWCDTDTCDGSMAARLITAELGADSLIKARN
ncbi:shikimate kinase [Actinomyces minihominis]|uniref:shikimate kinase n=1 Tax=Actinomyces minihominis TaxID=2002838 RepID=UPI000C077658|nr:shikimate kinase [Actinomyces minihominis]